jgi:hypothetical protein
MSALSYASATDPIEGLMPSSAKVVGERDRGVLGEFKGSLQHRLG